MNFNVSKMVKIKNDRSEITDGSSSFSMTVDVITHHCCFQRLLHRTWVINFSVLICKKYSLVQTHSHKEKISHHVSRKYGAIAIS